MYAGSANLNVRVEADEHPSEQADREAGSSPELPGRPHSARPRWWRDSLRRRLLALADFLVACGALSLLVLFSGLTPLAFVLAPTWVLIAKVIGLYEVDHRALRHSTTDEMPRLAVWAGVGLTSAALVGGAFGSPEANLLAAVAAWAGTWIAAGIARSAARGMWRRSVEPERAVVLGQGALADGLIRKLRIFPDAHLEVVSQMPGPDDGGPTRDADLGEIVASADRILVAVDRLDPAWLGRLVVACRKAETKLTAVSPLRGIGLPVAHSGRFADETLLEFDTWDVSRSTAAIKRGFDVVVGTLCLAASAPLWPVIALAIKLDSKGPVLFKQTRAGLGGGPFRMLKFRTMRAGAAQEFERVVDLDSPLDHLTKPPADDGRITRVGRVLRRFSLDELPQLVNVVRGQMSLVGPRPEQVEVVERYRPEHAIRLNVKPGLTGPMQVSGRGELSLADRLAVELDYVENPSLTRDLRILSQTIPAIVSGRGAW